MSPNVEVLRGVRKLVRTLSPPKQAAADQPLHRSHPHLRASCRWDVITDAGLFDVYASFTKSDGGTVVLLNQAPVVLQCFCTSRIDTIVIRSATLGLSGIFPFWTWRKLFWSQDSNVLKTLVTLRSAADRRLLNKILNSSDVTFEYYGCDSGAGNLFIAQRSSVSEAVLADGRVLFDFSHDVVGFGSTNADAHD